MEPKFVLTEGQRMQLIRCLTFGDMDEEVYVDLRNWYLAATPARRYPCSEAVQRLWRGGHKITAIKLHREQCRPNGETRGLKEAKDDCEAIV